MSQKEDLVTKAEALGIDVDGRWSEETLQEKIDEAEALIANADEPEIKDEAQDDGDKPDEEDDDSDEEVPAKSWTIVSPKEHAKGMNKIRKAGAEKAKAKGAK